LSRKFFGTDGVRGIANTKLLPEFAFSLGQAAAIWAKTRSPGSRVALGADTRRSGGMLSAALSAGICSTGYDVLDLGIVPTPVVSYAVRKGDFCLGAVISASHNPAPDNGIKFVGGDGRKLPDEAEEEIESLLNQTFTRPWAEGVGQIEHGQDPVEGYLLQLESVLPEGLAGMSIAMDCAHGAAYKLAPELLRRLGANVLLTGVAPDGMNINAEGGATKPETICDFTRQSGSEIGVAFDGDADRVIFSDSHGRLINGDRTMGIWAVERKRRAQLDPPAVVGTVMSNGGFETYLKGHGITLERAAVGDKYVVQRMEATGAKIGGEQSGHIIFPEQGPTGDGLATMMQILEVMRNSNLSSSQIYEAYDSWPQLLVNIGVESSSGWQERLSDELAEAARLLDGQGRFSVRPSGTQPMIRVMVEATHYPLRDEVANLLTDSIVSKLGGHIHGRVDLTHALGD
jgi:phosphoglucosamine mutase